MRQALQQFGTSLFFAAISLLLVIGGLATALAEESVNLPPQATLTETSLPTSAPQLDGTTEAPATVGLLPSPTAFFSSPTITVTIPPSTSCPAPVGWSSYIVQLGDTLNSLATRYGLAATTLKEQNCLVTDELLPDTRLHVPPYPTATPIPCGPLPNWTLSYTVKSGDNLYRIGLKYRVNVAALQQSNCLGYSTDIKVGQQLTVPNVPTSTTVATSTPTATQTYTPSATVTDSPATATATFTPLPATETFTPVPPTNIFTPIPEETTTDIPATSETAEPEA